MPCFVTQTGLKKCGGDVDETECPFPAFVMVGLDRGPLKKNGLHFIAPMIAE